MDDIITRDARELLDNIDNPIIAEEAAQVATQSQSDLLRSTMFSFLRRQMHSISKYETVIDNALSLLNERIVAKELDVEATLKVINSLSSQVTGKTAVIIEPFKPAPQSSSPLLTPPKATDDNDFERGLSSMSSDDLKVLDKFFRVASSIKEDNKE